MGDSELIKCVVCADDATPRVVKDTGFNTMMGLLWEALDVDVKYTENIKFDLCPSCFEQVLKFYDLNDACVIMENRIQKLTRKMVNKAIVGVEKLKEDGRSTLEVQDKIIEKHGSKPVNDEPGIKFEYEFECRVEDTVAVNNGPKKNEKTGNTRKSEFSFINMNTPKPKGAKQVEKNGSESGNTQKVQSAIRAPIARRGRGRGRGRGAPTRGKRLISSEEEEEDVFTESEESDDSDDLPPKKLPARAVKGRIEKKAESESSADDKGEEDEKSEASVSSQNSGKSRLQCEICLTAVVNVKSYEAHIKRHTIQPGEGYQCRVCRQAYVKKDDYLRHKKVHDDGKYPCPVCKIMCDVESKIIQHVQTVHRDFWIRQPQKLLPAGSD